MTARLTYEALRHFADSWGLVAMGLLFLALVAWPFLFSAGDGRDAATVIFEDDDDGR